MIGGIDPESPRHYPNPMTALLLATAGLFTTFFVSVAFASGGWDLGSVGLGQAVGFGLIGTLAARLVPEPQAERIGMHGFSPQLVPALLLMIPAVFLLSEIDNWITDLIPTELPEELKEMIEEERANQTPVSIAQRAILLVGIVPVVQEWLYRGVILQGLVAYLGRAGGLMLTSLLFGMTAATWLGAMNLSSVFITTALVGALLGFVRLATGSLLASILVHAALNAVGLFAYVAADSFPIQGFNTTPPSHSSATLIVPSIAFVCVGSMLLTRALRDQPPTLPLPPPRPRED